MFYLALRQLLSRKKQSAAIFIGIALGTITYIFVAGMQLGFREFFVSRLVDNDGHIKISAREDIIDESTMTPIFFPKNNSLIHWIIPPSGKRNEDHILYPQGWFYRLNQDPDTLAYSEQLIIPVFANRGDTKQAASLMGIDPSKHARVTVIEKYVKEGKFQDIGLSGNKIIVGTGLLKKLGARVTETLLLSTGTNTPRPFKVTGSFNIGVQQIDDTFIYGALRDVQQLNASPGRVSHISVRIDDATNARTIAERWSQFGMDRVQSWDQVNENFMHVFKIQDIFRIFITFSILVVAGFGIYNVLSILVNQKRREIAILRSLGFPPRDILGLFLLQGLMLGIAGALIGLALGYALCVFMTKVNIDVMGQRGFVMSFKISIYVIAFLMAVLSSIIAALLPAQAASRLTPIDIIRMEG